MENNMFTEKKPRREPWERPTLYNSGQEAHSSQVMHMSALDQDRP